MRINSWVHTDAGAIGSAVIGEEVGAEISTGIGLFFGGFWAVRRDNWYDYGVRWCDPAVGRFTSVDPLAEKYTKWNPYNYALNNPIKFIDRDGLDVYLSFYRLHNMIKIMDDNGTPDDFSDDIFIGEYPAHNNTVNVNQQWPDGSYNMIDRRTTHRHNTGDTPNGPYGTNGIYRAHAFTQANGVYRSGMGVHAGRENRPFENRLSEGCVRTTPECINAIQNAIDNFGDLSRIILNSIDNPYLDPTPEQPEQTPRPPVDITPLPTIVPQPLPIPPRPLPPPMPQPGPGQA
jgi:RHS repeat-associated protein